MKNPIASLPTKGNVIPFPVAVSRRQALAGALVVSAGALAPAAAAATKGPKSSDACFWRAHDAWKALREAWDADHDESDEAFDRWGTLEIEARERMLMIEVASAPAIAAKLRSVGNTDFPLPAPIGHAQRMILQDLDRLSKN